MFENNLEEEYETRKDGMVRVWSVKNLLPGKDKGKTYYMISPNVEEKGIVARIKDKANSPNSRGGISKLAKRMASMGDNYQDLFKIKKMSSWVTRERGVEIRNNFSKNALSHNGKIYNDLGGSNN